MGLEARLQQVLARAGYARSELIGQCDSRTPASEWSEIYHADSSRAQQRVTVKIKTNGSIKERDAVADVANVPNKTIATQYSAHELVESGVRYTLLPRAFLPNHIPLNTLTSVNEKQFIETALMLAEDLSVIHERKLCLGDIKPTNILITPQGKEPRYIDFDNATQFGEPLLRYTEGFTRDTIASASADAFSLKQTILWISQRHGFFHHEPFRTLNSEDARNAQDIVAILDAPRKKRRRVIKTLGGIALVSLAGQAERMREKHNAKVYAESENAAIESFDGSDKSQHTLGVALAKKVGDLTNSVYAPLKDSTSVPVRFSPDGTVMNADISFPSGSAIVGLLAAASPYDARIFSSLTSYEQAFINSIMRDGFTYPLHSNLFVEPLLASWKITKNRAALEAIIKAGDWLCEPKHIFHHAGGLIIPFRRDELSQAAKPFVNALDVRSGEVMIAATQAAQFIGKDPALYKQTLIEFCNSLQKTIFENSIHQYTLFDKQPSPVGPRHALGQAMTASLFWEAGNLLSDDKLRSISAKLLNPLLTTFPKEFFDSGNTDSYTASIAYQLCRKQERRDYRVILPGLVNRVPKAIIHKSLFTELERKRNELIGGVCIPPPEENDSWSDVGTPAADATFLSGLLYH